MNPSTTYDVVVDGTLLPGHDATQATAALVQRFGLSEDAAADLLRGGREVVKQGLDLARSETYVAALRRCGVVARAERVPGAAAQPGGGDAAIQVDYAAAYVPKAPPTRTPPPPIPAFRAVEREAPSRSDASFGVVGWTYIVTVPLALVLLAFGDALGRGAMLLTVGALLVTTATGLWMLAVVWSEGGALWAIAGFFFSPLILLFVIRRWDVAREPFLTNLAFVLVYVAGIGSMVNVGAVECGAPGSFSYDVGDSCVCEEGYDWCGEQDNDMSCCRM